MCSQNARIVISEPLFRGGMPQNPEYEPPPPEKTKTLRLWRYIYLSMRRKSAQCKTEELFLCTAVSNSVRDLE